jgi:integrase
MPCIDENPFDGAKATATGIKDRQRFVTREEIARGLDACPDQHWRDIVALSRFGGLRRPSEVLSLTWQDVDCEAGRIVVTSPKTEHHVDKANRTIPLFPELRNPLTEALDLAPEGADFVVDSKLILSLIQNSVSRLWGREGGETPICGRLLKRSVGAPAYDRGLACFTICGLAAKPNWRSHIPCRWSPVGSGILRALPCGIT